MFIPFRTVRAAAVLVGVLVSGVALASEPLAPLAPAEALAVIEGESPPQVLDVRSADEYADGHVPGAVLIPHDELGARLAELDRDRPVLVYCRSGRRSTIAEALLAAEGFEVRQIDGSWLRWQEEKMPVQMPDAGAGAGAGAEAHPEQELGE